MVAPSKLFTPHLNCYHCSQFIIHPGIGCFRYYLNNLLTHGVAGLKYFSPLLITPMVLKYQSMNREFLMHTVKYYLQTVLGSSLATASIFFCVCCLRNLLGEFHMYTTLFLPTVLGLQFCWFFPTRVMKLFTTATSQAVLEGLTRQYSNKFTHLILYSPIVQTIFFMLNSAIVLHNKRKNIYKDFWFIQSHEKCTTTKIANGEQTAQETGKYYMKCQTECDHTNVSCATFLIDGIKSYIFCGISLDLLGTFMGGKSSQRTHGLIKKLIKNCKTFRPNMTGFFVSYVGIYRLSSCLLRKYYSHLIPDVQHMLAAFFGGLSFMFVQRFNFVSLSLVIAIQILWQQLCNNIKTKSSKGKTNLVLMILKNAPLSQIILSINCGYLVHNYVLNHHLVNSLARGFLDGLTNNKPKNIRKIIIKNDVQSFIEMAKKHSVKTFL